MTGPAERTPAQRLQPAVTRAVAHRREMILLAAQCGQWRPSGAASLKRLVRPGVQPIINARLQTASGLHQSDFQTGLGERVSSDAAARAAAHDANVEDLFSH